MQDWIKCPHCDNSWPRKNNGDYGYEHKKSHDKAPPAPAEMPYEALRNKVRDLIYAQGCTSAERADRIIDLVRASTPAPADAEELAGKLLEEMVQSDAIEEFNGPKMMDILMRFVSNQTPSAIHKLVSDQQAIHKPAPADAKAEELWKWIEWYMEEECGHVPDYINEAERSNLINGISQFQSAAHQRGYGDGLEEAAILAKRDYTSRCGHVVLAQASKKADALANAIRALRKAEREGK